ncbi:drug resistance transporter, EmrB/QacA subfamily [Micromonospora pattaloongensis]|uniref:Drug resistance transporter, EmrB/QacA subfamily n=1 Tax=Micromonospora pattaloongensis TaxID=405436 RepID=A0A1H3HG95_9ACTN|nr:MFS transporter [Micromonospora pattaloongensis]SDY13699.1 drug resistance transporter, EmrB/QacA subfamily [Micromonospora pattaloongensis]
MTEPPATLRLASPAGRGVMLATTLASGMAFLDATVVNVALPHLGRELHASTAGLQWTVDGYLLTLAAFVLLGGALGDRYGRRRVFVIGVVWFTVASVLSGLAGGVELLIAARVLQGVGAALLTPGSLSVLRASFHPDDRGRAIGVWSGLSGVSTAVGPFLGGWLIDALSWRWIFFLNLPLGALVLLAALRWVPESRDPATERPPFDLAGALLGALGLGGVAYALIEAPARGPGSASVLAAVAFGVAATALFVAVERRRGSAAMLPPELFAVRLFGVLNLYTVAIYAALGGQLFFLSVQLQTVAHYSALQTGLATLPITILLAAGSPAAGALAARIGPRLLLVAGPLVGGLGVLLLRGVGPNAPYWTDVLPGVSLFGLGMMMVVAPLTTAVLGAVDDRFSGVASGFNNAAARAGGLLAVAALPLLVGLSGSAYQMPGAFTAAFRAAMLWCAGLMLAGAALAALFVRKGPSSAQPG